MYSEATRRAAMQQARDTGDPALSERVTLVQEIDGPKQPGFIIYSPVYHGREIPRDIAARREQLWGFCYAPFRAEDLFKKLAAKNDLRPARFAVYDGRGVEAKNLLYEQLPPPDGQHRDWTPRAFEITMAGRVWTVRFWVPSQRLAASPLAAGVLIGGLGLSLILFYLTRAEGRAREQAERVAAQLRESELALRQSGENMRLMIQSARDYAIYSLDTAGRISSWNVGAERLFGYPEAEIVRQEPDLLFTPEDREKGIPKQELVLATQAGVSQSEFWQTRRDGGRFWASRVVHPIRGVDGVLQGFLTIAQDITVQMEARAKLVREKEFSEAIIGSLPGIFLVVNEQAALVRWNQALERLTGLAEPELTGRSVPELTAQGDRERLGAAIKEAFATGGVAVEISLTQPDGQRSPFLFSASRMHLGDAPCLIGIGVDIASQKAVEQSLHETREQLRGYAVSLEERVRERTAELHQSLASLEGVLYHVAHDLRAPLRAMGSFISILLEEYASGFDERGRGYANRVTDAAHRMDDLLLDLLAYGRLAHMEIPLTKIDLDEQVRSVLSRMRQRVEAAETEVEITSPLGVVCANQGVVTDTLGQLLGNALKFAAGDRRPRIRIWSETNGSMVRLWVEDNGIGIAPEYHQRVFRIFERLHAHGVYSGNGIGLAIVQKSVERMGGHVGLDSETGRGSRFWVELPKP